MAQIRDVRKQAFYWIDNEFLDQYGSKVGLAGIAVYNAIARRANNETGKAWPGLTDIMRLTGLSKQGAINALRRLEEVGLISIEKRFNPERNAFDSSVYRLLSIEVVNPVDQGSQLSRPGVVNSVDQGSQLSRQEQHELTTLEEQHELTTPDNNKAALPAVAAYMLKKHNVDMETFNGLSMNIAAWLVYAETQPNLKNPAGYAITMSKKSVTPERLYREVVEFDFPIDKLPGALKNEQLYRQHVMGGGDPYEDTEDLSDEAINLMMRILK